MGFSAVLGSSSPSPTSSRSLHVGNPLRLLSGIDMRSTVNEFDVPADANTHIVAASAAA